MTSKHTIVDIIVAWTRLNLFDSILLSKVNYHVIHYLWLASEQSANVLFIVFGVLLLTLFFVKLMIRLCGSFQFHREQSDCVLLCGAVKIV